MRTTGSACSFAPSSRHALIVFDDADPTCRRRPPTGTGWNNVPAAGGSLRFLQHSLGLSGISSLREQVKPRRYFVNFFGDGQTIGLVPISVGRGGVAGFWSEILEAMARPQGIRIPVTAVKGRCPRPLDEGRARARRDIEAFRPLPQIPDGATERAGMWCPAASDLRFHAHHLPVFGIDTHGSFGGSGAPVCRNSIVILSGERTKAMPCHRAAAG